MVKVFSPGQSHGQGAAWLPARLALVLTFALVGPERVLAQPPPASRHASVEQNRQQCAGHGQGGAVPPKGRR